MKREHYEPTAAEINKVCKQIKEQKKAEMRLCRAKPNKGKAKIGKIAEYITPTPLEHR